MSNDAASARKTPDGKAAHGISIFRPSCSRSWLHLQVLVGGVAREGGKG